MICIAQCPLRRVRGLAWCLGLSMERIIAMIAFKVCYGHDCVDFPSIWVVVALTS